MRARIPFLVSSGEASGDRIAALVLAALGRRARAFGMGGAGSLQAGMDVLVPLSHVTAMGLWPIAGKLPALRRAFRSLLQAASVRRPPVALLIGFTSFHQALGRKLRASGVRVLWCVAPQVWAWRPSRLQSLRPSVDRLAVILPFEEPLWRRHGYDACYVGHPAMDATRRSDRAGHRPRLVVLAGSRDQEVHATARPFLRAAKRFVQSHRAWKTETIVASSLSARAERTVRRQARRCGIRCLPAEPVWGAARMLSHYELALCASGTASLEATLAGVPVVVGYRCDPVTALVARRLLRTDHIALPNILLQRRAFPELVQGDLRPARIVDRLQALMDDDPAAQAACEQVRGILRHEDARDFGERLGEEVMRLVTGRPE